MNKARALKIYEEICEAQGEHNGRWLNECDQEDSSEDYLEFMKEICTDLKIEFDPDLESYREDKDDHEYMVKDCMGFQLAMIAKSKLRDIILA